MLRKVVFLTFSSVILSYIGKIGGFGAGITQEYQRITVNNGENSL